MYFEVALNFLSLIMALLCTYLITFRSIAVSFPLSMVGLDPTTQLFRHH